jgi:hypothetical protein
MMHITVFLVINLNLYEQLHSHSGKMWYYIFFIIDTIMWNMLEYSHH